MLEFGREVALEIVLDEEDAEEIGIAAGAENVPGKSREAKSGDGDWVKKKESVAPALRQERPEEDGTSAENDCGGAFGKNCQAEEKSKKDEGEPWRSRDDGSVFVSREANGDSSSDHGDGQHAAEGHIRGGGVREADHADGGGKKEQEPARGLRAVEAQCEPGHRQRGKERGDRARQTSCGFTHAKEFEAQRRAPVKERRLLEPRFAVEVGRDPVACLDHVASDPGVAGLVRTDEADGAEMAEVTDVKSCYEENGPADSCGGFVPGFFSNLVGRFSHRNVSLVPFQFVRVNCRNPIAESLGQVFLPRTVSYIVQSAAASELLKQASL